MIIKCASCGNSLEVPGDLLFGQNVVCPFCSCKFSYAGPDGEVAVGALGRQKALSVRPRQNPIKAPRFSENMPSDKGNAVRGIVIAAILVVLAVVAFMQYSKFAKKRAYDEQVRLEQERAEFARLEKERELERERERRETEEREAKLRQAKEEEEARAERERQERLEKMKRENEAKKLEVEKLAAAYENYRRIFNAFGAKSAEYYSKDSSKKIDDAEVLWYVNETFQQDGRIYEVKKNGDVLVFLPDRLAENLPGGLNLSEISSKFGLIDIGDRVLICGIGRPAKVCPVPRRGEGVQPLCVELGEFFDTALELGINAPNKRYRVTLRRQGGGNVAVLGIVNAGEVVSWDKIESAAKGVLEKNLRRASSKLKPPVPKKMRRTVVFYDGGMSKKDISGLVHIPRKFQYRYHGDINYSARERAREEWERFREIAEKEDEEEQKIAEENLLAQKEFEQRAKAMNIDVVEESAIDSFLADCELLVEREGAEKSKNDGKQNEMKKSPPKSNASKGPIKCYKCKGQGTIKSSVREQCDMCLGQGVITHEIELDNSHYVGDRWNKKKSKAGYDCPKCKRRGRLLVEKEVECPVCHGRGSL